ncbi:LamB/YcsF family protein [Siccirubricoccus deserti]|uniref:LamB/YcsF family protein n=1 Tax=Siccirubricoccus deserti TaxID=2013562 RepID=A0A9X0UCE0_9PROT|nr:LamB/YcsF family protein [Siccirubricoccus deserti]
MLRGVSADGQHRCGVGEGFGQYRPGDDAALMPLIDLAKGACGFHAADPVQMQAAARQAHVAEAALG